MLCAWCSRAAAEIPSDKLLKSLRHPGDINDFAGILTPTEKAALVERCRKLRKELRGQVVVVTLKSLAGGQIDDFAVKLFEQWGVGDEEKDNGVLLLVALEDHKARIETGKGVEGILPDALCGRVLDEQLFPAFKQGRYGEGLIAAVNRIAEIIERNEPAAAHLANPAMPAAQLVMLTLVLSAFVAVGSLGIGTGLGSRVGSMIFFGLLFGGFAFGIGCAKAFPWAPVVHSAVGLVCAWIGWRIGRNSPETFRQSGHSSNDDAWTWGALSGGDSSGSGWSGGGFSGGGDWGGFGGGSSGGGGASGSW